MSIELPKDAEGREIPLDTVVLFGGNGNAYNIIGWIYVTDFDLSNSMAGQWRALTDKFTRLDPELMYLTPPDSWEKLLEDLGEAGDARYFHCSDCGWDGQIWEYIGFGDMLAYEAVHCPKCGAIIERRA